MFVLTVFVVTRVYYILFLSEEVVCQNMFNKVEAREGFEPSIFGLRDRRLSHLATTPCHIICDSSFSNFLTGKQIILIKF